MNDNWVHLTTAPDQLTAEMWVSILRNEGIVAVIVPSDAVSFLGISSMNCRLRVREDQLAQAREVLGDDALDS